MRFGYGGWLKTAFVAAVLILAGCGGDDDDNGNGNGNGDEHELGGTAGNVRNGTWAVTTETVSIQCEFEETVTANEDICNLESRFEVVLAEAQVACTMDTVGGSYELACSGNSSVTEGGITCPVEITVDGSGEFTDTTYTFEGTVVVTTVGPCSGVLTCEFAIDEVGFWLNSTADCEDDTTDAAPRLPFSPAWRTILGVD